MPKQLLNKISLTQNEIGIAYRFGKRGQWRTAERANGKAYVGVK
jgi:hypothetical protein